MEKFKLNDKTYEVRWTYDFVTLTTTCTITSPDFPNKQSCGVAIAGKKDNFCKREGRKRSFQAALGTNNINKVVITTDGSIEIHSEFIKLPKQITEFSFEDIKALYRAMKILKKEDQKKSKTLIIDEAELFYFTKEERTEIWYQAYYFNTSLVKT